jgi:hypothetical protein
MCGAVMFYPTAHVFASIAVGGVVYTGSLFLLKGVTIRDLSELLGRVA